ncbi:SDR family oxidoreductase [bacterium]|nr:SDR family oxidoreductase [bacterium]
MGDILAMFRLDGKAAVLTGGGGILAAGMAEALGLAGARVALCDLFPDKAEAVAKHLSGLGIDARAYKMDVMDPAAIRTVAETIYSDLGRVDVLVNAAGGNQKAATTAPDLSFFDIELEPLQKVIGLNLFGGAILPSQAFGRRMKDQPEGGSIINISSMSAYRPLTRIAGYSAAKAAVSNFTQWLAVHLAQEYNPKLRVNAIAPGFFLTDQNRFLLTDEKTGELTARGRQVIDHTPMGCFGDASDLNGVTLWLASPASRFVTGTVVPIDGGFSAFSGV